MLAITKLPKRHGASNGIADLTKKELGVSEDSIGRMDYGGDHKNHLSTDVLAANGDGPRQLADFSPNDRSTE